MDTKVSQIHRKSSDSARGKIDLRPDFLLGYFLGLIIGDGWVNLTKSRNYVIGLETTRMDYARLFKRTIQKRFPSLRVFTYDRTKFRRFPNGQTTSSPSRITWINSEALYSMLRPCKLDDFHWYVPGVVLASEECRLGFLRGIFDAEGSVDVHGHVILLSSKHRSNLLQVKDLLRGFGLRCWIKKSASVLRISSRGNCMRFQKVVGFGYLPKKKKLASICVAKYGPNIVSEARRLRELGLTYGEIACRLGVKTESSIGEWLRGEKLPPAVRFRWPE